MNDISTSMSLLRLLRFVERDVLHDYLLIMIFVLKLDTPDGVNLVERTNEILIRLVFKKNMYSRGINNSMNDSAIYYQDFD